jgi:hypothetical protein
MNTHTDKTQKNKSQSVANEVSQRHGRSKTTFRFVDNRPETIAQRKLQEMVDNSPPVAEMGTAEMGLFRPVEYILSTTCPLTGCTSISSFSLTIIYRNPKYGV